MTRLKGYVGRDLWVNLSTGEMTERDPGDELRRRFLGGYGLGARMIFDNQPAGIDPLGPESIFGITTGPFTGSPAPGGNRWAAVAKSPLTGGWGDANGSGYVGPALKQAGYDNVYFTGISPEPVYLAIIDGRAELLPADELWGQDSYFVDDWVKAKYGKKAESLCIGPASEKLSLISGIVTHKGRMAARSGLGAVMGSKKLKALVVRGTTQIDVADPDYVKEVRRKWLADIKAGLGVADFLKTMGTPGFASMSVEMGDSPTRNWGASVKAFSDYERIDFEHLRQHREKRHTCWHCPVACWSTSELDYGGEHLVVHEPEYETMAAFGSMSLNSNFASMVAVNDICNRSGLDTISTGGAVAFAIECFEHGLITEADTGGLTLSWGDHESIVALTGKIARREDIGDLLADGVMRAAQALGPEAEPFAIHIGGQELPMHDPRFEPALAVIYALNATPGRHTQAGQFGLPMGFPSDKPEFGETPEKQEGRGAYVRECTLMNHVIQASGLCLQTGDSTQVDNFMALLSAITGHDYTLDELLLVGETIANMRQAFTVREGVNLVKNPVPARVLGLPPLKEGPTAGISVDLEGMGREFLEAMDWTLDGAVPTAEKLRSLGLDAVARALWSE
jgi:aldehyde:ferredoxin oxidoreductase